MSLVAIDGTPLITLGYPHPKSLFMPTASGLGANATGAGFIFYGQIFTEDGASHTIDTTGSSSIGWRTGAVTFANAGTTVKVGLATMDTANGPPGRPTNAAGVITFDVSKSLTGGGGGITANAWQEHVPDSGSKTIANGDLVAFAVQMTVKAGADSVIGTATSAGGNSTALPSVTTVSAGTFSASSSLPNAVITFSDGTLGFFWCGFVLNVAASSQAYNSGSSPNEYGNFFQMPFPTKIYGIVAALTVGGDCDFVLYSDPLGTPVAQKTYSVDSNAIASSSAQDFVYALFSSPYSTTANQPLAAILKPTTITSITFIYNSVNAAAHQKAFPLGANSYAVNRSSGAFAAQNSNKDRFGIGLLVGAFDAANAPVGKIVSSQHGTPF